jgi:hypothetical protein
MNSVLLDLESRAARYGGTLGDILAETPTYLWDSPTELEMFWADRDLSHIMPQSKYPELADLWTNIMPEDSSVNRARGAEVMTQEEIELAELDNQISALEIDSMITDDSAEFAAEVIELVTA